MSGNSEETIIGDENTIYDEINKEIDEIGDIDISQAVPNEEILAALRKMIDGLPEEKRMELLANLQKGNNINPNDNAFSSTSIKKMRDEKLKRKIQKARRARTTKDAQHFMQIKKANAIEKNKKESDNKNEVDK